MVEDPGAGGSPTEQEALGARGHFLRGVGADKEEAGWLRWGWKGWRDFLLHDPFATGLLHSDLISLIT